LWREGISAQFDSVDGILFLVFNPRVAVGGMWVVSRADLTDYARMRSCRANEDAASRIVHTDNQRGPTRGHHTGVGERLRRGS